MAHDEHVTVTMTEVDGTKTELRVLPDRTIGFVRRRAQLTGAPRLNLCCEGALLADETLVRSLPAHRELTAWYPRYSRAQGGVSAQKSAARAVLDREQVRRTVSLLVATVRAVLRAIPIGEWLRFGIWSAVFYAALRTGVGGPFLIVSALWLVWRVGFSDGSTDGTSAYTVFNRDFVALPGQIQAEDLQRDMVGM